MIPFQFENIYIKNSYLFEYPWKIATFIVPWNELHNSINHHYSQALKPKCYIILATNTYKKTFDT